jgi:hypothetical protein
MAEKEKDKEVFVAERYATNSLLEEQKTRKVVQWRMQQRVYTITFT